MAHLLRLSAWGVVAVAACVLALLPLRAHAHGIVPKSSTPFWYPAGQLSTTCRSGSHSAAATCWIASNWGYAIQSVSYVQNSPTSYTVLGILKIPGSTSSTIAANFAVIAETATACPAGSTELPNPSRCVCSEGMKPALSPATGCVAVSCLAVQGSLLGSSLQWTGNTSSVCYQGCQFGSNARGYLTATNTSSTEGSLLYGTGTCAGDELEGNGPGARDAIKCPVQQCPGTVNGAAVCVPCAASTQGPETSASAPTGGGPAPSLPGAPAGSTSSSESTTCEGGKCTTTTTFKDAAGAETGRVEKTEEQKTFCGENPESPVCKDSTISGTCGAVTCDGDAVQCAIAREQARRMCEFFEPTGAAVDAGNLAASGELRPAGHPGASPDTFDLANVIDQTDRLSGSCPADQTFQLNGATFTLALSKLCTPVSMVGNALVGVALLWAVFIVFRG